MIKIKNFTPRLYQETILHTCVEKSCLVVLPTGIGKTAISMLLAVHRLNNFADSKILILAPSRPLVAQHLETFKKHLSINPEELTLFTGFVKPSERAKLWKRAKCVFSTPQCIQNDLANNRINLKDFSLLVVDECHRSVKDYSYVNVAKKYMEQSTNPRILALTASPGGTKEKIKEIYENLNMESVEIRTEQDLEVKPYVQEKKIEWINVELPIEFKEIKNLIKNVYSDKVKKLKKFGITKPTYLINKKDLLKLQIDFRKKINRGDKTAFSGISLVAQAIKLSHASELLETQSIASFKKFLEKLQKESTRAARVIMNNRNIIQAMSLAEGLIQEKIQHPKMENLCEIIQTELEKNPDSKFIVFANFRYTVDEIINNLKNIPNANPIKLVGQKEGLTQKKQIQTIKEFENEIYNILVGTSILEEGLDVRGGAEIAIFYDHVATSIRRIQRTGRVGRLKPGKIIFLITMGTRDAAYYWKSKHDEKRMKFLLRDMQNKSEKQTELF